MTLEHTVHVPDCDRVLALSASLRQHWSAVRDQGQNAFTVGPHAFEVEGEHDSAAHRVTLGGPLEGSLGVQGSSLDPTRQVFDLAEQQAPAGQVARRLSENPTLGAHD